MTAPSIVIYGGQESRAQVKVDATPICNPLFSSIEGDIVLRSLEGTLYQVPTFILRSNSGFFNTMLSLPQAEIHQDDSGVPVIPPILDVNENDFPVKTLLCLMSGVPIIELETINAFERVLHLAEKWDTPKPLNTLRSILTTHRFIEIHPLRCYRLTTHFSWKKEAKLASSHSLSLDIFNPIHRDTLDQLSSNDLLSLFHLHRKRQVMFRELLHCPERFVAGNSSPYYCLRCGITELDNSPWRNLKNRMFVEMERRPIGDGLNIGDAGWPEAQACWESRCSKEDCRAPKYDRFMTMRQIKACITLLPETIECED